MMILKELLWERQVLILKMSPKAKENIHYKFECKNQEKYKSIYNAYEQVDLNEDAGESILVIKK